MKIYLFMYLISFICFIATIVMGWSDIKNIDGSFHYALIAVLVCITIIGILGTIAK